MRDKINQSHFNLLPVHVDGNRVWAEVILTGGESARVPPWSGVGVRKEDWLSLPPVALATVSPEEELWEASPVAVGGGGGGRYRKWTVGQ